MLWASVIPARRAEIIIPKWDKQSVVFQATYWESEEISAGENKIKIIMQFRADFFVRTECFAELVTRIDSYQVDNSLALFSTTVSVEYQVGKRISKKASLHAIVLQIIVQFSDAFLCWECFVGLFTHVDSMSISLWQLQWHFFPQAYQIGKRLSKKFISYWF